MLQLSSGMLGGVAVALTLSAVQLAFGRDLYGGFQQSGFQFTESRTQAADAAGPATPVNRAAKSDRARRITVLSQTRTISLRLDRLSDTSILVRIPLAGAVRNIPLAPATIPAKATVACEPVVSVLTDIAKRLQPGRCVT